MERPAVSPSRRQVVRGALAFAVRNRVDAGRVDVARREALSPSPPLPWRPHRRSPLKIVVLSGRGTGFVSSSGETTWPTGHVGAYPAPPGPAFVRPLSPTEDRMKALKTLLVLCVLSGFGAAIA